MVFDSEGFPCGVGGMYVRLFESCQKHRLAAGYSRLEKGVEITLDTPGGRYLTYAATVKRAWSVLAVLF